LYTPDNGNQTGKLDRRGGGENPLFKQSRRECTIIVCPESNCKFWPFHQNIFEEGEIKLSPFQPDIGRYATFEDI